MTAFAQDFNTYVGDTATPIFSVLDQSGVAIDISTVSNVIWNAMRSTALPPAISKSLGSGVTLIGGGHSGQLQVTLTGADTTALIGVYVHQVLLIDAVGNQSTVSLGQLTVGRQPSWTYDPTQLATNPLMQVRRLIGDTKKNDQQQWDEEINFALAQRVNSIYGAAADCCRNLAAEMSRQVDLVQGELKTNYSNRAKAYMVLSRNYEMLAAIRGPGVPYAGGISIADKQRQEQDADRVSPNFTIGMTDNFVLGGGGGPQTETLNSPGFEDELPDV